MGRIYFERVQDSAQEFVSVALNMQSATTHSTITHGLWEASAPPGPPTPPLATHTAADAVVVGAGFTGCSAALHLALGGWRVAVLEAKHIGYGASGRNVGLVNAGLWVMPDELPKLLGMERGERLLRQLGDAPRLVFDLIERHSLACEARRSGTIHCAVGKSGVAEINTRAQQWQKRRADVEVLNESETARRVGTTAYSASLLDRRAGTIQPLAYVRGLAHAAIAAGAAFHSQSPVTAREDLGTSWKLHTSNGSVSAPWVIVATDVYSTNAFRPLAQGQVMLPYFNLATAPLPAGLRDSILPERQGAWDTKQILSSFRFDDAGRLIFGSVGALRGTGTPIHRAWGRRELRRLFPQLESINFEHEWCGMIGMTDDALPRLHRHDRNIYSISGYNGRGIAPGTTFGRDLARLAMGAIAIDDLSLPLSTMTAARLRTVKTAFYEVGAQIAHFLGSR